MVNVFTSWLNFLRTRRARLTPEEVGLPNRRRRRTPGLRREEVAELADIGVSWYTSLEQGRDVHPSPQVLDSLARALRLDADERRHLFRLAQRPLRASPPAEEQASPMFRRLWEEHDVLTLPRCHKKMHHPRLGPLEFEMMTLQEHPEAHVKVVVYMASQETAATLAEQARR